MNSVPPRSLNCNGYPGLEYGGNSINTTANTQTATNTSSSQTTQMQPPLTQSPSRQQPSRPNSSSHMMYQQQSPSHYNNNNNLHMSPTSQAQSPSSQSTNGGSTTPNMNQQYQQQLTPTSHHHAEDWNRNWNGNPQAVENFNQADRINLNTRLKTMILNKNEKDQQQTSTGHFLSYSHQHLPEQQQPLTNDININNNSNSKANNNGTKLIEAGDDGGFKMNDSWKSSVMKQEQEESKNKNFFEQKQQLSEETMGDPGGTKEAKDVKNSTERENSTDAKVIEQQTSVGNNQYAFPPTGDLHNNLPKSEKTSESERERQTSFSYHSAHEYQQHQNMVNNIKKEPGGDEALAGNVKFEGYEKNYQNFIRYADFCDAQQPQYDSHQKQTQYQQDYMQSQGYYNNYPYQNYPHHQSQNYSQQHSQNYQQFMSQQAAYQQHGHHHPASLTNFEQQIPLHTYPIPKHTTSKNGETPLPISSIKNESMPSNPLHPYPFLSENVVGINKSSALHYSRNIGNVVNENPCDIMSPKEEVRIFIES